ncbi:MAG TPA: cation:proton antiporter, partial [Phycisphaerales bacterium]|nr:cation:proton antiporter [Phycisphaerales bacterium]
MSNANLTLMFFLQAAAVLLACRAAGSLARRLRQPEAVGHMIAGIALGPSLLGASLPDVQSWLFPTGSRPLLHVVAQVGLVLYMFLVGVEFRLDLFRLKARAAGAIAAAGMIVPLLVGMGIAAWLHGTEPRQFGEGVSRLQAMVFLGAAMSITAFPMMARMIAERGLSTSAVGTLLLAAGAIDDVLAWCVLALLPALVGSGAAAGWWPAAFAFGGGAAFVAVVAVIRPLMKRLHPPAEPGALVLPSPALTAVLTMLALAAWCTDLVGVHSVFGAFVVGAAVPRGWLSEGLLRTLTPVVTALLLPFYFVSSGLSTRVTLIDSWWMWVVAAVIVVGACAGKLLACAAAARLSGEGGRESLAIGAMMNARGLMELMVLNIGL